MFGTEKSEISSELALKIQTARIVNPTRTDNDIEKVDWDSPWQAALCVYVNCVLS